MNKIINIAATLQKTGAVLFACFLFAGSGFAQQRKLSPAQEEKLRLKNERRAVSPELSNGKKESVIEMELKQKK